MHKTKLINYLKACSKSEMTQLGKFLHSPYFNHRQSLILFFEELKKAYPNFATKQMTKERIFHKIFPEKRFDNKKMTDLMSDLVQKIERFWIAESINHSSRLFKKIKVKALNNRELYAYFEKEITQLIAEVEANAIKSLTDYQDILELNHLMYFHATTDKSKLHVQSIQSLMTQTDIHFAYAKILYALELINRKGILQEDYEILLLAEIKQKLIPKLQNASPDLLLLIRLLALITSPISKQMFEKTYEYWFNNTSKVNAQIKQIGFFLLLNYSIKSHQKNVDYFKKMTSDLFQYGYAKKILLVNNQLSFPSFLNYINAVTPFQSPEKIQRFLQGARHYLQPKHQELVFNFGTAYFFYLTKKFQDCANLINQLQNIPLFLRLPFRSLQFRNAYELALIDQRYFDTFFKIGQRFSTFLKKENVHTNNKLKSYQNMVDFLYSMGQYKQKNTYTAKVQDQFIKEITNAESVYLRAWLLLKARDS